MEFGVFVPTTNNGWIVSETSPQYLPSFDLAQQVVRKAEEHDFAFALSQVKLRGWGGKTEAWDYALESFTTMSALAAVTSRIKLYASVAVLTVHPAIVARMAATIDDISGGRFGVNIVSGWNASEYEQMNLWPGNSYYKERYDYSTEYATVLRELWQDGVSNFKGDHFQLEDCRLAPRPSAGDIELVCAGSSDRGLKFTAEYGNYAFTMVGDGAEGLQKANAKLLEAGRTAGRDVRSFALYFVIIADTDEEALAREARYREGADLEALANLTGLASKDTGGSTSGRINELRQATFMGNEIIAGSPATVAAAFNELSTAEGTAGFMLIFDDWLDGIERFGTEVKPLLHDVVVAA